MERSEIRGPVPADDIPGLRCAPFGLRLLSPGRHCERSEVIRSSFEAGWIASLRSH
jgi:hypothetical protein